LTDGNYTYPQPLAVMLTRLTRHMKSKIKIVLILVITGFSQLLGFSQEYKTIWISKDIELIEISENAFIHVSYSELPNLGRFPSNGLIYMDNGKAYLFDTPMTDTLTKELVKWIKDSLKLEIVGFIPNHWHDDCMGGLSYLKSVGVNSYANQMTINIARLKGLPVPAHGFNDSLILKLNDKWIKCFYLGKAHSLDNIVVWIPSERILFAGCMCKEFNAKDLGNTIDGDLTEWPKTIDRVIAKFPTSKFVIPGHGQFGGLELLRHTKNLLTK
jgi:metallo-beta-lactamase class B